MDDSMLLGKRTFESDINFELNFMDNITPANDGIFSIPPTPLDITQKSTDRTIRPVRKLSAAKKMNLIIDTNQAD
jgi:hypothetical protein